MLSGAGSEGVDVWEGAAPQPSATTLSSSKSMEGRRFMSCARYTTPNAASPGGAW